MSTTIEEKAFAAYKADKELPVKYQTPDRCWIDWYKKGYMEALKCMEENKKPEEINSTY